MNNFNRGGGRFEKRGGSGGFGGRSGGGGGFNKSFGGGRGGDRGDRPSFPAICGECGDECTVPFRPTGERSVLCSNCFRKDDNRGGNDRPFRRDDGFKKFSDAPKQENYRQDFMELNKKLDMIIRALEITKVHTIEKAPAKLEASAKIEDIADSKPAKKAKKTAEKTEEKKPAKKPAKKSK